MFIGSPFCFIGLFSLARENVKFRYGGDGSTGTARLVEIKEAVQAFWKNYSGPWMFLNSRSAYLAKIKVMNL